MTKERFERRAYRRSPGRQYDYDPLNSQNRNASTQIRQEDGSQEADRWSSNGETDSRSSGQLAPRPNPRRTRQLLRQSIIASKYHSTTLPEEDAEQDYDQADTDQYTDEDEQRAYQSYAEADDGTLYSNRYRARNGVPPTPTHAYRPVRPSASQQYVETGEDEAADDEWNEFEFVDPDIGYEDPLDRRSEYAQAPVIKSLVPRSPASTRRLPERRREDPAEYDDYEEDEYIDERAERPARRKSRKRGLTRRKVLVGLGVAAVGGVAAYELGPKIPQALHDAGTNIERQVEDAYNKGLAAGAEAVRKEFVTALSNLEGVSLSGAINAAKVTRVAYDAFVSPLITLAATVTGDFLNLTLRSVIQGRGWLARINQDNDTLAALQTVLETWVKQVNKVPKEWQTIADTDLDAAQSYLRALQRKIQDEQAKVNSDATATAGTPTSMPKATGTPKH
jgi:hypothetical protein